MFSPHHAGQIVLGLGIWAVWFVVLYGGLSVGCVAAPPDVAAGIFNWLNASLLILTLATAAMLLYLARRCWAYSCDIGHDNRTETRDRFIPRVAATCHLSAAGATLMIGLPVIALPPCL